MSELYSIPVEQAVLSSLMDHEQGSGDYIEQLTEMPQNVLYDAIGIYQRWYIQ